jgi:DNA-binding transcriptional ArsR family regulator
MSLGEPAAARRGQARLRALAHPVRLRILSLLTATPMTAAEVARELRLTHANASYHLRQLLDAGVIKVAGTERIRGGKAKRYRYDADHSLRRRGPEPPAGAGTARDHQLLYAALAAELQRRVTQLRSIRGSFLADAELWVDPRDWDDVREKISSAATDLHRAAKPARSPGTIHVNATIALFQMEAGA